VAQALASVILTVSPHRIILGGGVMQQETLLPLIRRNVALLLNGYIAKTEVQEGIDRYIVRPQLGRYSGVLGAILLAARIER
jgi:fructokinase